MKYIATPLLLVLLLTNAFGQFSSKQQFNIPAVTKVITCVEDFNGDQNLDLLISGFDGQAFTHRVYINVDGDFATNNYSSIDIKGQALSAFGIDYNANGLLDVLMTSTDKGIATLGLYENKGNVYQKISRVLDVYTFDSLVAFPINYNQDVFTDILVFGRTGKSSTAILFENKNGLTFIEHRLSLGNNSRMDVSIAKSNITNQPQFLWTENVNNIAVTSLYEISKEGNLINQNAKLPIIIGKTAMLDIDADNDLDIYVNGIANGKLYHGFLANSSNDFNNPKFVLPPAKQSQINFQDFNNDGLLDAVLIGKFASDSSLVKTFTNTGIDWATGKTIAVVENANCNVITLKDANISQLLIMGVENGNKYTFNQWTGLTKTHTLTLNTPLVANVLKNIVSIKWSKPTGSLPKSVIGYDYRVLKNDKLVVDFQNPSFNSTKIITADSIALKLDVGNYKFELRAFDGSGKISNVKEISFAIQKESVTGLFDIMSVSGLIGINLNNNTQIVDINQDGNQDMIGVTTNNMCVPLLQASTNYFVPQQSFAASNLALTSTRTSTFNSYYLDKGILYKLDLATNIVKNTGIIDVLSFSVFDIDNDGDDDVYAFNFKEIKGLLYLYEEGEFQKSKTEITDSKKIPWKVADLNNDGYTDIITQSDSAKVFTNYIGWNLKGDSIKWQKLPVSKNELIDIVDADNDGKLDLLAYDTKYSTLSTYNYKNSFTQLSELKVRLPDGELIPREIKFHNFDADQVNELVYFNNDSVCVVKQINDNYDSIVKQALGFPYQVDAASPYIEVADFDNDKRPDIFLQYVTKDGYQSLILYNKQNASTVPAKPNNPKSVVLQNNATLSWSPVRNAKYYKVEFWTKKEKILNAGIITTSNGYTNSLPNLGMLYDTVFRFSNLPNDSCYWRVYAVNGNQVSAPSATSSFLIQSYIAKKITSLNDTAMLGDMGGQQFSHPCDFDNDGDMDFLFLSTGRDTLVGSMSFIGGNYIYINNGDGSFRTQKINIADLYTSDVAFFDFNKDGYQDIAITAAGLKMANTHWEENSRVIKSGVSDFFTKIYLNDKKNNFYDSKVALPAVGLGNIDVADYNQDGYPDLLISGRGVIAKMGDTPQWAAFLATYRKDSEDFKIDTICEKSIYTINSMFQDTDVDGDYDIFLLGRGITSNKVTQIIENKNGSYFENKILNRQETAIEGYDINYFDFGDFDRDGDQDLAICGTNFIVETPTLGAKRYFAQRHLPLPSPWNMKIYTNLGNNLFSPKDLNISTSLPSTRLHKMKWLDYNNDGQLEIVAQYDHNTFMVVQKTDGNFIISEEGQVHDTCTYSTFGDFNNDGKIDFVIGGQRTAFKCYLNNIDKTNLSPTVITEISSIVADNSVNIRWKNSGDDHTSGRSLKYAVELYNEKGLLYSNANFKTIPTEDYDNYFYSTNRTFKNLPDGRYYWRVAAIDDNYKISNFSQVDSFKIALRPVISGKKDVCNYDIVTYTVLPANVSQACNLPNALCPKYKWEILDGSGLITYKDTTANSNQVVIKWGREGKHLIKVTNPIYKMDTTLEVDVKFNPIPRIDYVFVDDTIGNRTLKFKDSLTSIVSKYSWKFGESSSAVDTSSNPIFTFPESGIYPVTLTVQYKNSCVNSYKRNVELQNPKIDGGRRSVCKGDTVVYKVGPKNFKYVWKVENGTIINDTTMLSIRVVWSNVGTGKITVTSTTAITSLSDSMNIIINDVPNAQITIPESLGTNSLIQFKDTILGDKTDMKYNWFFGEFDKRYQYSSPKVIFEQSGPHIIIFTATNKYQCSVTIKEIVEVTENLVPITIANLITQNNDGFNDYLFVENIDRFPDAEVKLYAPLGKLIFNTTNYQNDWKPGAAGVAELPEGSYLCTVNISSMNKKFEQIITVLK